MKRWIAVAAVIGGALSHAAAAHAATGIPGPGNISIDANHINLVGIWSTASNKWSAADSLLYGARVTVTVRDLSNNPIAGRPVTIDFSGCPGLLISGTQSYHGMTSGCSTPTVSNFSTTNGTVSFVVVGSIQSRNSEPVWGCAAVYVDSYLIASLGVSAYDQTGSGGFTLADIGFFWTDLNSGRYHARCDLDGNGYLTLADIAHAWDANLHVFDVSATTVCSNPPPYPGPGGSYDPGPVNPGPKRTP